LRARSTHQAPNSGAQPPNQMGCFMRIQLLLAVGMAGLLALATATRASASPNPVLYTDVDAFHAAGTIDQVTDFDALYPGAPSQFLPDTFVDGDISITSDGLNTLVAKGAGSTYFAVRNSFANNNDEKIVGQITQPGYNMIGFWIGSLIGADDVTVNFTLNDGFYGTGVASWPAQEGFRFAGFIAPEGRYFTGFSLKANDTNGFHRIGVAQFELGHTGAAVPEPATWAMMILGFGAIGAAGRRRRPVLRTA
jgi:hypothetical protein